MNKAPEVQGSWQGSEIQNTSLLYIFVLMKVLTIPIFFTDVLPLLIRKLATSSIDIHIKQL